MNDDTFEFDTSGYSSDDKVFKVALKLAKVAIKGMDKVADKSLPKNLADIVKLHSKIAVGSSFIPIPGADVLAAAGNIWTMYARINNLLNMPFQENILKSIAAGVATNLGTYFAGSLIIGTASKIVPGIGSLFGTVLIAATIYGLTITSGIIYMNALTMLLESNNSGNINEADLKSSIDKIMSDKEAIKQVFNEAKNSYKKEN